MKSFHHALIPAIVPFLVACIDFAGENETLTPLPFTVTARGTAFYGKDGLHAPGPTNQLCLGFLDRPVIRRGSSPDRAQIERPGRNVGELAAVLVDNDSTRIPLQFAGIRNTNWGQLAC